MDYDGCTSAGQPMNAQGLGGGTCREWMLLYQGYSSRQLSWVGDWAPRVLPQTEFLRC